MITASHEMPREKSTAAFNSVVPSHNTQLQRTVIRHRMRAGCNAFRQDRNEKAVAASVQRVTLGDDTRSKVTQNIPPLSGALDGIVVAVELRRHLTVSGL